jgi:hypothetical protein
VHEQLEVWGKTGRTPRDALAKQITVSLTARGIRLVGSEVPIRAEAAQVATAIDEIGEDADGRVVVLEFKAGYQRGTHGQTPLRHIVSSVVPSTPVNHATLQLAMTRAILMEEYGVHVDQYLLVISNGTGVELRALPLWAMQVKIAQLSTR